MKWSHGQNVKGNVSFYMTGVHFTGWKYGFQKVSFAKLLRYELGFSLGDAKSRTDALMDGQTFVVRTEAVAEAEDLLRKTSELGAICELVSENG